MLSKSIKSLRKSVSKRFEIADLAWSAGPLKGWFESDFGAYIKAFERRTMGALYSQLPGYRLLSLGVPADSQLADNFAQLHRFSVYPAESDGLHAAICNYDQLPIPSGVVDVVLLQHSLEFSASPKAVLAEVGRVVMPGGHLLLCVFNPYGFFGGLKWFMQLFFNRPQYRFHNLRCNRLSDWLSLLSFQVLDVHYGAFNPMGKAHPEGADLAAWDDWCERANLPCGNVYIIHAVKRERQGIGRRSVKWHRPAYGYSHRKTGGPILSSNAITQRYKSTEESHAAR